MSADPATNGFIIITVICGGIVLITFIGFVIYFIVTARQRRQRRQERARERRRLQKGSRAHRTYSPYLLPDQDEVEPLTSQANVDPQTLEEGDITHTMREEHSLPRIPPPIPVQFAPPNVVLTSPTSAGQTTGVPSLRPLSTVAPPRPAGPRSPASPTTASRRASLWVDNASIFDRLDRQAAEASQSTSRVPEPSLKKGHRPNLSLDIPSKPPVKAQTMTPPSQVASPYAPGPSALSSAYTSTNSNTTTPSGTVTLSIQGTPSRSNTLASNLTPLTARSRSNTILSNLATVSESGSSGGSAENGRDTETERGDNNNNTRRAQDDAPSPRRNTFGSFRILDGFH
ncbi:hypothetical protein DL96DRAFT_1555409 [Flagelloscypha sp. PMI_526]|nr:hypothetical protein DL96DRAFT_1555409 [Flagelloscypha sp. PMI_526]